MKFLQICLQRKLEIFYTYKFHIIFHTHRILIYKILLIINDFLGCYEYNIIDIYFTPSKKVTIKLKAYIG